MQASYWDFHIGDTLALGMLLLGGCGYALDKRRDRRDSVDLIQKQERMHTENRERLDDLRRFRDFQEALNDKRDQQVNVLTTLAATSTEMLKGFNRRLELQEEEVKEIRNRCDGRHFGKQ